ncbi:heparin lyase I family protein, partial [Pontibacter sp. 13R65]|uniref:heparin lyase I family protein n=1 Tax=Pontibacter sp. 13R65 TaxID=3127458 RepID=UPI00301D9F3F
MFSGVSKQYTVNAHAFSVVDNPSGTGKVGRFELRQGDARQSGGTRAEVQFPRQKGENANDRWFAFSVYLPSEYWQNDRKQDIITQWHQGPTNPPMSLRIINGRMFLDV